MYINNKSQTTNFNVTLIVFYYFISVYQPVIIIEIYTNIKTAVNQLLTNINLLIFA